GGQPPLDPKSDEDDAHTEATQRFAKDTEGQAALADTVPLGEVDPYDFDAVFYPGGHGPLWDLAESQDSIVLLQAFYAAN
ncbi:MAG TPA: type 1 glutamine amidotransferase domain-containing protein, partial [Pseudomonas sp.]|nr:type 1 glutamine amidotransferase domain-containing protein [Pseudomonas sp.]